MSFKVEKLSGEPIILSTIYPDYNLFEEIAISDQAAMDLLDAATQPMFMIIDLQVQLDFGQITIGADIEARGSNPLWHHKNMRQVILVTTNKMVPLAAKGMASQLYGYVNVEVFETVDEALRYIRAQE
ncbi:MAG: hypothetical protein HY866_21290 [Chloroflexi bacterium]|nr:hypothetical protein [Chloroflexota bacterium]